MTPPSLSLFIYESLLGGTTPGTRARRPRDIMRYEFSYLNAKGELLE